MRTTAHRLSIERKRDIHEDQMRCLSGKKGKNILKILYINRFIPPRIHLFCDGLCHDKVIFYDHDLIHSSFPF